MNLIKKADVVLIICLVIFAVVFLFIFQPPNLKSLNFRKNSDTNLKNEALIMIKGEFYKSIPLVSSDNSNFTEKIKSESNIVTNIIEISDNSIRMTYSNCKDKTCIRQGKISLNGQIIVCLPNGITIEVVASNGDSVDSIVK